MRSQAFPKTQRLTSKKLIEQLFEQGKAINLSPLRVITLQNPVQENTETEALFTVPSRNFKRAVDRNLLKRRMREAYRLNKSQLPPEPKWLLAYIYIAKEILPYKVIEQKMVEALKRLK
jgi:ribonuclease P protein component